MRVRPDQSRADPDVNLSIHPAPIVQPLLGAVRFIGAFPSETAPIPPVVVVLHAPTPRFTQRTRFTDHPNFATEPAREGDAVDVLLVLMLIGDMVQSRPANSRAL